MKNIHTENLAEDYLPDPGDERNTSARHEEWAGKKLFALSHSMREQWMCLTRANDTPSFMAATLIVLLTRAHEIYTAAIKSGCDIETACDAVRLEALRQVHRYEETRLAAMRLIDETMNSKKLSMDACILTGKILERIAKSAPETPQEPQSSAEEEAIDLGKRKTARQRKQRCRGKRSKSS